MTNTAKRIDSHQHFWRLARKDYGWLTPELTTLYRDFLPEHLAPLLRAANIDATVLVQAAPTVEETAYLLSLAGEEDFIAGVVGWVDMTRGHEAVATLGRLAQNPKFRGIRPMIQEIEDPEWMLDKRLAPVFEALIEGDLCFDALVKPEHLPCLLELLRRYPALKAVIDHGAKPRIAASEWEPWAEDLAHIASGASVCCKLSGLITEAAPEQSDADLRPYFDHLLDLFGPGRLLWGSDWPVLNLAGDYAAWHETCSQWTAELSAAERRGIFGENAIRFYGLKPGRRNPEGY